MSNATQQETHEINNLIGAWFMVRDVGSRGVSGPEEPTCKRVEYPVAINPKEVVAVRLITAEERNRPLGLEKDGSIPGIHPKATSVIVTQSQGTGIRKTYIRDDVNEAISQLLGETPASVDLQDFSQTAKLILAVAQANPEALPELTGGWKISQPISSYKPA